MFVSPTDFLASLVGQIVVFSGQIDFITSLKSSGIISRPDRFSRKLTGFVFQARRILSVSFVHYFFDFRQEKHRHWFGCNVMCFSCHVHVMWCHVNVSRSHILTELSTKLSILYTHRTLDLMSIKNQSDIDPKGDRQQDASWDGIWRFLDRYVHDLGPKSGAKLGPSWHQHRKK